MAWLRNRFINWMAKGLDSDNYGTVELNRAIYDYFGRGNIFITDNNSRSIITDGYESNVDVFSITNKISTLFASIKLKPFRDGKELETDPISELFESNNIDKTFFEFKKEWELFNLITGNSIVHNPTLKGGNNAGKIYKMVNLPTQNIEITFGSVNNLLEGYKFDTGDQRILISPEEIWHSRMFLNLIYENGKNLMGISPVRVAATVIDAQNKGYEMTANTFKNLLPPIIVTNESKSDPLTPEQRSRMERLFSRKTGSKKAGKPFFTTGKIGVHKLGYENFKDLNIIENNENGVRVLCNVWGVPSELFNDSKSSTYNNEKEAAKAMYNNRIIPDLNMFVSGLNRLFKPINISYEADTSEISALQQDKLEKAKIFDMGIKNKSVTQNEFRTNVLGLDELGDDELEELRMNGEFDNNTNNLERLLEDNKL